VHLELAEIRVTELGQRGHQLGVVDLRREEERVARWTTIRVAEALGQPGILVDPAGYAGQPLRSIGAMMIGLIVIGDAEEDVRVGVTPSEEADRSAEGSGGLGSTSCELLNWTRVGS